MPPPGPSAPQPKTLPPMADVPPPAPGSPPTADLAPPDPEPLPPNGAAPIPSTLAPPAPPTLPPPPRATLPLPPRRDSSPPAPPPPQASVSAPATSKEATPLGHETTRREPSAAGGRARPCSVPPRHLRLPETLWARCCPAENMKGADIPSLADILVDYQQTSHSPIQCLSLQQTITRGRETGTPRRRTPPCIQAGRGGRRKQGSAGTRPTSSTLARRSTAASRTTRGLPQRAPPCARDNTVTPQRTRV